MFKDSDTNFCFRGNGKLFILLLFNLIFLIFVIYLLSLLINEKVDILLFPIVAT